MRIHHMWDAYPELQTDISRVLQFIESHIRVRDDTIEAVIRELMLPGGKLLRPAYTLLCSKIGPRQTEENAVALAAAIETLHMATLVHDDVIDESVTRRGMTTLHERFGNKFAIYAGDYLFCLCFSILSRYASSLIQNGFDFLSMEKILDGELAQLHARFQSQVSVKHYLARISGKTARLFAIGCYFGALSSEASEKAARAAWNMGHYIGMAFQIKDDILDYEGEQARVGKPVLHDIRQGIYTLPFIYAMKEEEERLRPYLERREQLSDEHAEEVKELIIKAGGIEHAQSVADRYTSKALAQLALMPDGDYKQTLKKLTLQLLRRDT